MKDMKVSEEALKKLIHKMKVLSVPISKGQPNLLKACLLRKCITVPAVMSLKLGSLHFGPLGCVLDGY